MKNCVWVKWARLTVQFLWLGKEKNNNVSVAEARRIINYRDARNAFFDAAETVGQMIEFGYISTESDQFWFLPPNMYEHERGDRAVTDVRARYFREIFFANRNPRRMAILELEDRVSRYMWSCSTTLPYDARLLRQRRDQERAIQRELDTARDLGVITPFSPTDEQQSTPLRHVAITRYSPTGTPRRRTRIELSGEYVPMEIGQTEPSVSAINVGALRAPTSGDDRYCMLDSGANVMVIPRMEGMVGDETMCCLVGDNRATGLIVSRLYIGTKSYLVVAVQNAAVLLPPAYLVRIAGYRLSWANHSGGEIFHLKDGYGESVAVHEDDDLLYLNKNTFWRVAKDMFSAAQNRTGMDWPSIWQALTGERVEDVAINAIKSSESTTQVDFVELYNPGNFKAQKGTLTAGKTYDVKVDPSLDLTRTSVQDQTRQSIAQENPLVLIGAPPCTVFSPMQNINQNIRTKPLSAQIAVVRSVFCFADALQNRAYFFLRLSPGPKSREASCAVLLVCTGEAARVGDIPQENLTLLLYGVTEESQVALRVTARVVKISVATIGRHGEVTALFQLLC